MPNSDFSYIDIHAHLNFRDFDQDREDVIGQMMESGVGAINVGTNMATSREVVGLAESHDNLWAIVGVHPHEAGRGFDLGELINLTASPKVVAIGECGLDYFNLASDDLKPMQQLLFEQQIELATQVGKPLMLHIRDSYQEVLDILSNYPDVRAHAHFFAGDWAIARRFLDRGDTISFTGVITFARQYDEVIKKAPLDRLMAETDCPFVSPEPFRGKRNDPNKVSLVVRRIAEIRSQSEDLVRESLLVNAGQTFGLWS